MNGQTARRLQEIGRDRQGEVRAAAARRRAEDDRTGRVASPRISRLARESGREG